MFNVHNKGHTLDLVIMHTDSVSLIDQINVVDAELVDRAGNMCVTIMQ